MHKSIQPNMFASTYQGNNSFLTQTGQSMVMSVDGLMKDKQALVV